MLIKLGVFSLSASSPDGDDSRYLRWHHLDHLPQQYEIAGMLVRPTLGVDARMPGGSRRAVGTLRAGQPRGALPVRRARRPAVDDFFALRDHLIEIGRFPERLPNRLVSGGEPVEAHAAASALVTADVVPYRPNRGAYLIIEQATRRARPHVGRPSTSNGCSRSTASPGSGRSRPPRCAPTSSARAGTASRCATSTRTRSRSRSRSGRARRPVGGRGDRTRVRGAVRVTATVRLRAPHKPTTRAR